jgi:hypothetical protein
MTRAEQQANWKDPRSVAFRATVHGWAFTDHKRLRAMAERAKEQAWLPEHHDLIETMLSIAEGNEL